VKSTQNYRFINWARNESCQAKNYFQPETEEELIEIIKAYPKIRVTGSGHSWNDICLTNEALINFDRLNTVLDLDIDKLQVKVQPGIKLWQLNEFLDKHGLALQNLGSISDQSVAGAISTGTHGTGINFQILGSQLEEFWLIKADGEKILIHKERDKELFDLALVNLGCLGIISSITLNVVPAFNLHDVTSVSNFDEVVDKLDELVAGTDHFKLWWFPHTEEVVVYQYTRTQNPVNDSRFRQWFMEELVSVNAYRLMLKIGTVNRDWRKRINKALVQKFIQPLDRVEKSFKVFNVPKPPLHRETEWAFDMRIAKDVLRDYKKMINASKHRINFLQEIRFTKADNFALSPAYGRNSLWLGAYNADNFGWDELLADFEVIAMKYKGRPHWGKEFKTAGKDYLHSVYPRLSDFNLLRQKFDPLNKFSNNYISKIFGV
jgi:sugar-1,4-lactone oxidase-like protein